MQHSQIGPYQIVAELGRGGMGVVYEVSDPSLPGRRLALKQILKDLCGPDALRRFAREAEMLAKVQHPNVVRVYACTLDPVAYLVTELVEGQDLQSLCVREHLAPERCAEIVAQLCDAIGALHSAGIIHRDLKPENAILRPDGTPVLLDFGLARELDGEGLTRTGEVLGTPAYMSPEQADAAKDIDERTDVYGLGAILFQLLAGRAPYQAESMVKLLYKVLQEEPDWKALEQREVPKALIAVTQRALEKERDDRYPSAQALAADLRRFLAGEAVMARPRRSSKGPLIGLGVVLALGCAGGAMALSQSGAPTPTPSATQSAKPSRTRWRPKTKLEKLRFPRHLADLSPQDRFQLTRPFLERHPEHRKGVIELLRAKPLWKHKAFPLPKRTGSEGNIERGALFLTPELILTWWGHSNEVVCVSVEEGTTLWSLELRELSANAVALSPDASSFVVFESPYTARRVSRPAAGWGERPSAAEVSPYKLSLVGLSDLDKKPVKQARFSPDGKLLALGLGSRIERRVAGALLVDRLDGERRARYLPEGKAITLSLVWGRESDRLFIGGSGIKAEKPPTVGYDLSSGEPQVVFRSRVSNANYATTHGLCLAGGDLIQAQKNTNIARFADYRNLTPDSRRAQNFRPAGVSVSQSHKAQVNSVVSDAKGEWVYSVSGNFLSLAVAKAKESEPGSNQIRVWRRGEQGFESHGAPVDLDWAPRWLVLHPDGDRLLVVNVTGSLLLYDAWLLRQE